MKENTKFEHAGNKFELINGWIFWILDENRRWNDQEIGGEFKSLRAAKSWITANWKKIDNMRD